MSSIEYVNIPLETDPDLLAQDVFEYIQTFYPNWLPNDGNLDVRIISAIARMAAESRDVISDVPTTIFRYFGTNLVNLPSLDGVAATINLTFTARDNAGYTIPAQTMVQATDNDGNLSFWQTIADAIIPPASTSITPVPALATETGTAFNSLSFSAGQVVLVDSLAFISTVVSVGATTGGEDSETDADYLNRLREDLTILSPKPIVPTDFAIMAKNFSGVARALAVDGYDNVANTYNNAKTISVFVVDSAGLAPPSPTLDAIQALLQSLREANFIIYVIGPYYASVTTQYTATKLAGFVAADVKASVDANIQAFLSPSTWGTPRVSDAANTGNTWTNKRIIRLSEVNAVIQDTAGVDSVTSLTIVGAAADYDMSPSAHPVAMPVWTSVGSTGVVT